MLMETMWNLFRQTGDIGAYLLYRQCLGCQPADAHPWQE